MTNTQDQQDEVGTIRREEHDDLTGKPGYTIWLLMADVPTRAQPEPHFYWFAVHSTAPGNIGCRSDEFGDDGDPWPVHEWPKVGVIPGSPAAA